ncbi:hypothetical protein B484DRAFT_390367 [Ochromonadaceae sp. CCMP2298]|nr:hypothetical protein B484DRAFT_390367 [Ochromonadaceae sp. CCMP2298]
MMLQRLFRGKRIAQEVQVLKNAAMRRVGARQVQRVWRGWLGRRRLLLKREFLHCLAAAAGHVSIKSLTPGDVEEMADNLDLFVRDYTRDLPPAVLSILRAVFFILNGGASECVVVNNDGYIEKQYIRAQSATWMGAKLVLHCLVQMRVVAEDLDLGELDEVDIGKHCLEQLHKYVCALYRAQQLQGLFPEYFEPGQV